MVRQRFSSLQPYPTPHVEICLEEIPRSRIFYPSAAVGDDPLTAGCGVCPRGHYLQGVSAHYISILLREKVREIGNLGLITDITRIYFESGVHIRQRVASRFEIWGNVLIPTSLLDF